MGPGSGSASPPRSSSTAGAGQAPLVPAATRKVGERILALKDVHTYYGHIHALQGISLEVREGEIVTLLGSNGAGKTTTLKTIHGLLHPREGSIEFEGAEVSRVPAHELVRRGIGQSPEGRRIFGRMTVLENLQMGAFSRRERATIDRDYARVFEL